MSKLDYSTTPFMDFGAGSIKKAGSLCFEKLAAKNLLIVTDPGIRKAGLLATLEKSLSSAGQKFEVFDNISSDPLELEVLEGVLKALEKSCDGVIGLGGGSPMDAAKAIAIILKSVTPITDLYGVNKVTQGRLPLMLIPTTAGTGSEATNYAVITTPLGEKISITDPASFPDIALLDPELTVGLPSNLTAATGIDAIVHAIEAFTSKGNKSEFSDRDAIKALKLLWKSVSEATANGDNQKARADALMGAYLAGQAIANAPVGGVHALAYPLGGLHHIHHGLSNALLLPPVLRFNMEAAVPLYAELADAVLLNLSGSDEARTAAFIGALEDMIKTCGLETRLNQVGIKEDHIPELAIEAMKLERLLKNNPREIALGDCQKIYEGIL